MTKYWNIQKENAKNELDILVSEIVVLKNLQTKIEYFTTKII